MPGCDVGVCEEAIKRLRDSLKISKLLRKSESAIKFSCRPCSSEGPEGGARAVLLDSTPLEIVVCTNRLADKEIEEVLVHELVHVYDHTNKRCDLSTCEGLAYTEVRAAREAECSRFFPFQWLKTECVRSHATRSTANLFSKEKAAKCVSATLDRAMADMSPFDDTKP